ncbi:MAG: hypothetical protein ACE5JI_17770 [Acidobacteriota bacterium]
MKKRLVVLGVALCFCVAAAPADTKERKPPKKPNEAFTVFVYADPRGSEKIKKRIFNATEELKKRIRKKKDWFLLSGSKDKAEIVVEVLQHLISEQFVNKLDTRVSRGGVSKEWVDVNYLSARHYVEARVTLLGHQMMLKGADERKRGGNMKRAVKDLAKQLEKYCKEHYWELTELR